MNGFYVSEDSFNIIKKLAGYPQSTKKIINFLTELQEDCVKKETIESPYERKVRVAKEKWEKFNQKPKKRKRVVDYTANQKLKEFAQNYRGERIESETAYEKIFNDTLIDMKIPFQREKIFYHDKSFYITDFYFPQKRVVVEIDGQYHQKEEQAVKDQERTDNLINKCGVDHVLRVRNEQIRDKYSCRLIIEDLKLK